MHSTENDKFQNNNDPLAEKNQLYDEDEIFVENLRDSTVLSGEIKPVKVSRKIFQILSITGLLININSKESDLDIFLAAFQKLFRDEHGKALIWLPDEKDLEEE